MSSVIQQILARLFLAITHMFLASEEPFQDSTREEQAGRDFGKRKYGKFYEHLLCRSLKLLISPHSAESQHAHKGRHDDSIVGIRHFGNNYLNKRERRC